MKPLDYHQTMSYWNISDFHKLAIKEQQVIKPRIQRQKRWTTEGNKNFILFLVKRRKSIIPFLLNEKIIESRKYYFLFDGNNRANAILDFMLAPLKLFPELIPDSLSDFRAFLEELSLETLTQPRYGLIDFFEDVHKRHPEEVLPEATKTLSKEFDKILDAVCAWKFSEVQMATTIECNLSDDDMCDIYTAINTGAKVLTKQELLAGSTFHIKFTRSDLPDYFDRLVGYLSDYYGKMSDNEKLTMEKSGSEERMTLFEVLVSFQTHLAATYDFIPDYTGEKDKDLVFSMYEYLGGTFDPKGASRVYTILKDIEYVIEGIRRAYDELYDPALMGQIKMKSYYPGAKKNHVILMGMFLLHNKERDVRSEFRRLVVFHDLLGVSKHKKEYSDPLNCSSLGMEKMKGIAKKLEEHKRFDSMPTVEDVVGLYRELLGDREPAEKRKPMNRIKALALSAFYNYGIPSHRKSEPHDVDHIVPFTTKDKSEVDICRLGNLQLIPLSVNRSRGRKPITDKWIEENDLMYQHYPSGEEYAGICQDGRIGSSERYNEMCERREELYVRNLHRLLS